MRTLTIHEHINCINKTKDKQNKMYELKNTFGIAHLLFVLY